MGRGSRASKALDRVWYNHAVSHHRQGGRPNATFKGGGFPDRRHQRVKPTKELIDAMYREEVERARATPPEEKLLAGLQMFDLVCRIMTDGIHDEFPDADEARVRQILKERLALARRLENLP